MDVETQENATSEGTQEIENALSAVDEVREGGDEISEALKLLPEGILRPGEEEEAIEEEGEEPTVEEPTTEEKPAEEAAPEGEGEAAPEPEGKLSKSWAAIKAAEKENRKARDELKSERLQLQNMQAQIEKMQQNQQDLLNNLNSDPFGTLEKVGLPFEKLATMVIEGKDKEVQDKPQESSEVSALKNDIQELKQMIQMRQAQDQDMAYQTQIDQVLSGDQFSILKTHPNAKGEIYDYAVAYAKQTGKILPPNEVAAILQPEWKSQLESMKAHKAVRKLFGLSDPTTNSGSDEPESPKANTVKKTEGGKPSSLSNVSAAPRKASPIPEDLSEEEEIALAAKQIAPGAWEDEE